jgi:UDP-sulfoquinovose synthase
VFGTVLNRFLVQAVSGIPLTVYGKGGQTRGFLNLRDTLQCIELAMTKPPAKGELRILNQFTETFSVNDLAEIVSRVGKELGLGVEVQTLSNPRKEAEEHYYNPKFSGLFELGLEPHYMTDDVVAGMLERLMPHRDQVDPDKIMPRVRWAGR